MQITTTKIALVAAALMAVGTLGTTAQAASLAPAAALPAVHSDAAAPQAVKFRRGIHIHFHGFGHRRFRPYYDYGYGYGYGAGCGFYHFKWQQTGLFHWKRKYFICRGIW